VVAAEPTVTPSVSEVKSGPLAKAGQDLITLYEEFQKQGGGTFTPSGIPPVKIQGNSVEIDAHISAGNFSNYVSALGSLGMQIKNLDEAHGIVEGYLPISQLPAAAQNPQTLSLTPVYGPAIAGMML